MKQAIVISLTLFLFIASLASGDAIISGSCSPSLDPNDWDSSTDGLIADQDSSTGSVTISNDSILASNHFYVGYAANSQGTLTILSGGILNTADTGSVGHQVDSISTALISGADSAWNLTGALNVGFSGNGYMTITDGATVSCTNGYLCYKLIGKATVDVSYGGVWDNNGPLIVGYANNYRSGTRDAILTITEGGLVNTTELTIGVMSNSYSYVRMTSGGMLAMPIDGIDDSTDIDENSLTLFLGEILGEKHDYLQWWNPSTSNWDFLNTTTATFGTDYAMEYIDSGDLAGYTRLTVGEATEIPEPSTLVLLLFGMLALPLARRLRA